MTDEELLARVGVILERMRMPLTPMVLGDLDEMIIASDRVDLAGRTWFPMFEILVPYLRDLSADGHSPSWVETLAALTPTDRRHLEDVLALADLEISLPEDPDDS